VFFPISTHSVFFKANVDLSIELKTKAGKLENLKTMSMVRSHPTYVWRQVQQICWITFW